MPSFAWVKSRVIEFTDWVEEQLRAHIRAKFPLLDDVPFSILLGKRGGHLSELEACTISYIKTQIPSGFARLWIRPLQELTHLPMGTPTVLARIPTDTSPHRDEVFPDPASPPHIQVTPPRIVLPVVSLELETSADLRVINEMDRNEDAEPSDAANSPQPSPQLSPLRLEVDDTVFEDIQRIQDGIPPGPFATVRVRRAFIVEDVMDLYKTVNVRTRLRVEFDGESGEDLGGLTKYLFSCFWEKALEDFFSGENSKIPFLSPSNRDKAITIFPTLGRILEHMVCLVGHLPPTLCRSAILAMSDFDYVPDEELLLDDFFRYLPVSQTFLLKECLQSGTWSENQERRMSLFYEEHKMPVNPSPANLRRKLLNAAQVELLDNSASFLGLMRRGISTFVKSEFFMKMNPAKIGQLFDSFDPTPEKVANLVEEVFQQETLSMLEVVITSYLSSLIREMDSGCLTRFLVWVTGSPVMPKTLTLAFNSSFGIARAPVAHTCGNVLELPVSYLTYQEFKRELMLVINSDAALDMTLL